jgi:hypothetical protein
MYQEILVGPWYNSIRGWKPLVHMRSVVQIQLDGYYLNNL